MKDRKVALVTGGTSKIGRHISVFLAKLGYTVFVHYKDNAQQAKEIKEIIESIDGACCYIVQADLTNMFDVDKMVSYVRSISPECSVLINNAAIYKESSWDTYSIDLNRNICCNYNAPVMLTYYLETSFSGKDRVSINMLDYNLGTYGSSYLPYSISKKMLADFTIATKLQDSKHGVRINGINLGQIVLPDSIDEVGKCKNTKILNILSVIEVIISKNYCGCLFNVK